MAGLGQGRAAMLCAAALSVWACGDDAGGAVAGLPGDTKLAELSEAQSVDLCEGLRARARADEDATRGACVLTASIAADLSGIVGVGEDPLEVCERELEACVSGEQATPCEPQAFGASCAATVAELGRCQDVAGDAFSELAAVTCEEATRDGGVIDELSTKVEAALEDCTARLEGCFDDDCCDESDSCDYADDDSCDCPEQSWDAADCGE